MRILGNNLKRIAVFLCLFTILFSVYVEAGGGRRRGGGGGGSPPPPCPAESPGCYKKTGTAVSTKFESGDPNYVRVAPGEITAEQFGYYLTENRCKQGGGCACYGLPVSPPVEEDPDQSGSACACIAATDYNAKGKCCGDDINDCGRISTGVLCSIDSNFQFAQWILSSITPGEIRYVGCNDQEYISTGSDWIPCDGTMWKKTVDGTEFMCTGKGRDTIVECCGDDTCISSGDGKRLSTGESTKVGDSNSTASPEITYYCTPEKKLVTDLDVPESFKTDKVLLASRKKTCEAAGFTWTGTKCCSEDDDPEEYYNDPGGKGACWNKEAIISVDFVPESDESVASYAGQFHGCAVEETNYNTDNDDFLLLMDQFTGEQLIEDHGYCFTDPGKTYFCNFNERWELAEGVDRGRLSTTPVEGAAIPSGCCGINDCWNGEDCTLNQKFNPLAKPLDNKYLCIDGSWKPANLKCTPDTNVCTGYCPDDSQCLISTFSLNGSSCMNSSEYVNDNYCDNGNWSSRTKYIALDLLSLRSGNFVMFCDTKDNALNTLKYFTPSKELASNALSNLQPNLFCVIKTGGKVIFGTSINKDIESLPASTIGLLGISGCSGGLINDGKYHPCDASDKVWYNKRMKSIIYSQSPVSLPDTSDSSLFITLIYNPIMDIISSIKSLILTPPYDESYLNSIKRFDKLFMSQENGKSIIGAIDGKTLRNAVIKYHGFSSDICRFADNYNQAKKDAASGISCKKGAENEYYVLVQGSRLTTLNPDIIWPDMTAKLRLE